MRFLSATLATLLLAHAPAWAGGYQAWQFGMTHEQVRAVGDAKRYYQFKNGDLGAGDEPFEDGQALLSFYFNGDHMQRVMLIAYMGEDAGLARAAWTRAYAHLARVCGGVEAPGKGAIDQAAAMAAYDTGVPLLAPGARHQMGCSPMPAGERVWASLTRGDGGKLMVAVNYAEPSP